MKDSAKRDVASGVLLEYQKAWLIDKSPVKVWEKSRRIGATYTLALGAVLRANQELSDSVYYISYNRDMTQEFIEACKTWAQALNCLIEPKGEGL